VEKNTSISGEKYIGGGEKYIGGAYNLLIISHL